MSKIRFLVAAVVLTVILAACSSGGTTTKMKLVEHADTDFVGDVTPTGDSIGDTLGFANPVFDEANAKQVGTDNGSCVRTAIGAAWECVWTLTLSDGQLTVEGPFFDTKDSVLAITGGTGAYQQARGQMTLHSRNDKGSEYDFAYEIIK